MQDVSDKLLGQFTACLEQKVGDASAASAAAAAEPTATDEPASRRAADPASAARRAGGPGQPERADAQRAAASAPPGEEPPRPQDDALDLGATVLPVLLKSYWRQALGVVLVLLVLRRLLRRG